jgi:hypothetical protein
MSRSFALLAAASVTAMLVVATSAASQTLPVRHRSLAFHAAATVGATPLSGAEIQARFVGNTVVGVENGEAYSEYIVPDGTIRGLGADGPYSGAWRIANGQLCFHYDESDGDGAAWDCSPVTLVGDKVYWSIGVGEGDSPEATLLYGNPKKL